MRIRTKITKTDFINLNFLLLYRRFFMRFLTVIGVLCLLTALLANLVGMRWPASQVVFGSIILLVLPALTYFSAKKNYSSNRRISENIEYVFHYDQLQVTGESFRSELSWDKIYKVIKTKNWILIWQSPQITNAIPRRDLWEGELHTLKEILLNNKVRNNL